MVLPLKEKEQKTTSKITTRICDESFCDCVFLSGFKTSDNKRRMRRVLLNTVVHSSRERFFSILAFRHFSVSLALFSNALIALRMLSQCSEILHDSVSYESDSYPPSFLTERRNPNIAWYRSVNSLLKHEELPNSRMWTVLGKRFDVSQKM